MQQKIKDIVGKLSIPPVEATKISNNVSLINDLGYDSIQLLKLIVLIENEIEIKVDFENIRHHIFHNYQDFECFVMSCNNN